MEAKITGDVSSVERNEKMEDAVMAINTFINAPERFKSDDEKKVFAERIYKYLSFYFSILPPEYLSEPSSLNKYFEAMNSHGKSLEQHEILKVELMKDEPSKEYFTKIWNAVSEMGRPIIRLNSDDETIETYRNHYEEAIRCCRTGDYDKAFSYCIEAFDKEDNDTILSIKAKRPEHGRQFTNQDEITDRSIISFPQFLSLVLDINLSIGGKYSFYRQDLITAFKENAVSNVRSFYYDMLFTRLLLDYYVITKEEGKTGNKYDILYGDCSGEDNLREKERVVQYQSMLYVSQTPVYEWLKPLIINLRQQRPESFSDILIWLKDTDDAYRKLPEKVELMSYKNVDRYWFWRLDYYLWERQEEFFPDNFEREIVNDYVFRANRSIEHLHPRHQEHNSEWDISDVHAFGNLAMISQGFNSEQSDDPVTVKFARIQDQANNHALQSLKLYKMFLDAGKTPGGWTTERMKAHQTEMYELLEESFNH